MYLENPKFWNESSPNFLIKLLLSPLSRVYSKISKMNYKRPYEYVSENAKVVAVGAVTMGGSGKTVVTSAICDILNMAKKKNAVLSRGYGRKNDEILLVNPDIHTFEEVGDEPLLLARKSPVIVGKNRGEAMHFANHHFNENFDFFILDDGIMQKSLQPNIRLVVIDSRQKFGNGEVFPLGPNRIYFEDIKDDIDAVIYLRNEGDTSMASNIATATLAGALAIIALYAVWKVYRWFVRDDGDEKEKSEATSEAKYISNQIEKDILSGRYVPVTEMGNPFSNKFNPMYNNVALAIIQESSTESEEAKRIKLLAIQNDINCAIRFSNNMLNDDPKFINYMNKNKPKIIISVQKWKDQAESSGTIEATQENKSITYTARDGNRYTILNEADSQENINTNNVDTSEDVIAKLEANNTDEESKGFFAKIKDKLAEIKNRFESSSNKAIRWIPNIIKLALGVLAVAAVYYGGRKYLFKVEEGTIPSDITDDDISTSVNNNSDSNITTNTEEPLPTDEEIDKEVTMATNENNCSLASYKFINTYLNSMSIISEAVEKVEESNIPNKEKVLDDLTGKGKELGDNIIEKAKSVSIDLLNDKEFITFANKNKITVVNDFKKA